MKLLITDTNVFFDMMSIEILPDFFGLDFEICTTDFVVAEIKKIEQADQIQTFIRSKQLTVFKFTVEELEAVLNLKTTRNLRRITDKSVLWKALELKCTLLTGDKNLRNEAQEQGLEVRGSLWVIRILAEKDKIRATQAIQFLELLKSVNGSVPKEEIDKLISQLKSK